MNDEQIKQMQTTIKELQDKLEKVQAEKDQAVSRLQSSNQPEGKVEKKIRELEEKFKLEIKGLSGKIGELIDALKDKTKKKPEEPKPPEKPKEDGGEWI